MEITVYSGFSKRINSTKRPTGGQTINVNLKHPTSVITPAFILTGFNLSWNYIQWGVRYYFVRDITILNENQALYSCELDVLATYKDIIGSSSQFVTRCASDFDGGVIDTKYPVKASATTAYSQLNSLTEQVWNFDFRNGGCYILAIMNKGYSGYGQGVITYYAVSESAMLNLIDYLFTGGWLVSQDLDVELQKLLCNPMQYIVDCFWLPFNLLNASYVVPKNLQFGYWTCPNAAGHLIPDAYRTLHFKGTMTVPRHPQAASRGKYLNGKPFTDLLLNIFTFGSIPLEPSYFIDSPTLEVSIRVDCYTGDGELILSNASGDIILAQTSNIGIPCMLGQTTSDVTAPILAAAGGLPTLAFGNVIGFTQGIVSAAENLLPQVQRSGLNGSKTAYERIPLLTATFRQLCNEDNAQFGRPLCATKTINTLAGFVQCENSDIDIVGTADEKRAIISYLESGFFYE